MASETKPVLRLRSGEHRILLVIGDLLAAYLALAAGLYFWGRADPWEKIFLTFLKIRVDPWYYLLPLVWILFLVEMYELRRAANWRRTVRGVSVAALLLGLVYLLIYFTSLPGSVNRRAVTLFIILAPLLTLLWRWLYIRLYRLQGSVRRALVVGAGANGGTLAQIYAQLTPPPFQILGYIDDDPAKAGTSFEGFRIFGSSERLLDLADKMNATEVIVSITGEMRGQTFQILLDAQERGLEVTRMSTIYEELLGRVPIHHLEADWVLRSFIDEARASVFYENAARLLDVLGSVVGLLLFGLLFPFLAVIMLLDDGLPLFYTQTRYGKGARIFEMLKLRTMIKNAEADGHARPASENDPRVTRAGNFLRRTRLDELPQFWNVLRGEMSIVGPRAERPELVQKYQKQIPFYRARLMVKPGITGWAQINYGYASTIEDTEIKLEYDLYYIKHRSILMDLVIILRTISTVLGRKGR